MIAALKNPAHRAWFVLIVAMLVIAFVKGRLVILDFMELREAPRLWRILLEGWLILVSSLILLAYWISLK